MWLYHLVIVVVCYIGHVTCACCPNGWLPYENSCYFFARDHASSFTEAENYCRQHHNAHLVEIETAAENLFLVNYVRGLRSESHWIGLTDEQIEGVWRWYNSDTVTAITDWYPGQPDNSANGVDDCVVLWPDHNFHWGDIDCAYKSNPICEIRQESEPIVVG